MRAFLRELPWSKCERDELFVIIPDQEIEIDADRRTVRVYKTLRDIMGKEIKNKRRFGKGKIWIEKIGDIDE